ncbi:rieske (2Fe-2S) domain protein [Luminiphilus syltensis NOR5-1B]|uniref:Rieske (2Fe-2S) domain protein n=2 Tax=Luminiphilus TaxID=1341118 RepID=B8KSN8_9GAMM|nr:rieske (2Fe-2S) domain protein [Luminiphilus syltensis NOR5-1B]
MRVDSSQYTDPAFYEKEVAAIFKKLPVMVAVSHEIPETGDFLTRDYQGVPLLITRQADGSAKVLMNVCTHRGMTLTQAESGNKRVFTCPYHAWSFSGDGTLRGVAEAPKFGEDCRGDRDLVEFPSHEEGGLLFAVLDPDSTVDIRSYLGGMMDDVVQKGFKDWSYVGNRVIHGANWKIAYDGYLEGYHFKAAHPETIEPRTFSNIMEFDAHGPHVFIGFPQKGILKHKDTPEEDLWKFENDGYDYIRLFFPNVSIFVAPEITQVAQLIPGPTVDQNTTILHFLHPEPPADEAEAQARVEMVDWLRDVVDKEDYQLGLQVQRGLQAGHQKDVIFGRNERANQYVHKWIKYYVNGDESAPEPTL